jgi:hypothetical protein
LYVQELYWRNKKYTYKFSMFSLAKIELNRIGLHGN